jgi:hypothetical protein
MADNPAAVIETVAQERAGIPRAVVEASQLGDARICRKTFAVERDADFGASRIA